MAQTIDTLVIGAGQAGLATSYYLQRAGRSHLVLDQARIAESWRSGRWDAFTLVTPNWTLQLPGFRYGDEAGGNDPDGFLTRDEVVAHLEAYAERVAAPVRTGVRVDALAPEPDAGFVVRTGDGPFRARNVVVATGSYRKPRLPGCSERLSPAIDQLHSGAYRHPDALREGGVLVVGSGQSGVQIADELNRAGRHVVLAAGSAVSFPRSYRGKDLFWWADKVGLLDQTVDDLDSPDERFAANPQLVGTPEGRDLSLHHLARDGVTLAGRLEDARGTVVTFAGDLRSTLEQSDRVLAELKSNLQKAAAQLGLPAADGEPAAPRDGYRATPPTQLDLEEAGVSTVVWATGYAPDFGWIELPVLDAFGHPVHRRGVTRVPGLYFVGLHWLHRRKSALIYGVGEDARYVVEALTGRA